MSGQDSGSKTEPATPKRLRDARKRGEVPKSRDVTSTLGLALMMVLTGLACENSARRLAQLSLDTLAFHRLPFSNQLQQVGMEAVQVLIDLSALFLLPVAVFGLLVEFLQAGPVFSTEKLVPRLSHLDPVAGVKKMCSVDNVIEVLKSIAKTLVLFTVGYLIISSAIDRMVLLPGSSPFALIEAATALTVRLFGWTLGIFLLVMVLDSAYQHHAFARRMKMSVRDIRQEHKDSEGDPTTRGQRRQMHQDFAQNGANEAAANATVLVVNPTHVAIAIHYDRETSPVPRVTAKAEDEVARAMRDAAARHHVPVLRNVRLARTLLTLVDEGDYVPRDLFDVLAEVIAWATRTHQEVRAQQGEGHSDLRSDSRWPDSPGEDLTVYPLGPPLASRSAAGQAPDPASG